MNTQNTSASYNTKKSLNISLLFSAKTESGLWMEGRLYQFSPTLYEGKQQLLILLWLAKHYLALLIQKPFMSYPRVSIISSAVL